MSDNPFAEPEDDDRTIIVPRPAAPQAASAAQPVGCAPPDGDAPLFAAWDGGVAFKALPNASASPIISAAAPLLSLLAGLRNIVAVPDPARLRGRAVDEVRHFEQVLRDRSVPIDLIRLGHYALCASLDDVVQNTPWGSRGPWADASLVSTFHQEVKSGDRFFELLARLRESPGRFLPVIELMYLCMSLGMRGRYRLRPRGPAEHDSVREETYLVIVRQRGMAEKELSPRWRGVSAPYRALRREIPVWLAALIAAGIVGGLFAWITLTLNEASDGVFELALALPPVTMPAIARSEPPRPPVAIALPPGGREVLARALASDIRAGVLTVTGTEANPVIRLQSTGMFAVGSATPLPRFRPVLARVAAALKERRGEVRVVGYTDNQPIHTMAFPSNYQLSVARARSVAAVLGQAIDPARISADGRADADPIASNDTAAGREKNRRVEIVAGAAGTPL